MFLVRSRVLNLGNEDIGSADAGEFVHDGRDLLAFDHGLDGNPSVVFERGNGGGALARSDRASSDKLAALDVVGAENVFLSGYQHVLVTLT